MALNPSTRFLVDLRKLEFGDASAENDDFLDDDYVCNTALEKVIFNRARIVIGEKGSGKSAIFRIISNLKNYDKAKIGSEHIEEFLDEIDGKSVVTINEPHNLEAYKFLINQKKADDPDKFKILWLIYIAILVGKEVIEKSDYYHTNQGEVNSTRKCTT